MEYLSDDIRTEEMAKEQEVSEKGNVNRLELYIPKWVEMLPADHEIKESLLKLTGDLIRKETDSEALKSLALDALNQLEFVSKVIWENRPEEKNCIAVRIDVDEMWYYQMLSSLAGVEIGGEYQLISMIKELSELKAEYQNAKAALEEVRNTGYGVMKPKREEIRLEDPEVIHQGSKYGVKIRAYSPSIHLIKADIETEISPIVGNEQQAKDLISYIRESSQTEEGIWETNIFGKSIEQLIDDGIQTKLSQMNEESQEKLQRVMKRVVNETTGGFVCIIL